MTSSSTPPPPLPFLSMGKETYKVPLSMFANNRRKVVGKLLDDKVNTIIPPDGSLIYIEGGKSTTRYDSDHEPIFRQESYMWYLTGVKEPDVNVVIEINNESEDEYPKTTLFIPKLPAEYATIMGKIENRNEVNVN